MAQKNMNPILWYSMDPGLSTDVLHGARESFFIFLVKLLGYSFTNFGNYLKIICN